VKPRRGEAAPAAAAARIVLRLAFAVLAVGTLVAGVSGGLLRLGLQPLGAGPFIGQAAASHGALLISGFFGLVIGIERAVALRHAWTFAVPVLSAAAGLAWLSGEPARAAWLAVAASAMFVLVNARVLLLQPAAHTGLLLAAAVAWLAGSLGHAMGAPPAAVLSLWFFFLIVTIAAERLEMTRMMRRRPGAQAALLGILAALAGASAWAFQSPGAGGVAYGVALVLLAVWLACFDIARRTVKADGLTRYMAVCLLAGYAWLGAGGVAWAAMALGHPARDLALHAIGLGFVFSMVMGHAPVILPAVARVKLAFGAWFYVPLLLLHGSLLWRVAAGWADLPARVAGAGLNATALALFALSMAAGAAVWRLRHKR
jgi:hypothetical protein